MEDYHLDRLSILGQYLSANDQDIIRSDPLPLTFEGVLLDAEGVYVIFYFYQWVFMDMPFLFETWELRNKRAVHMLALENYSTAWSVINFFGFDIDQFLHLFTVGFQQPQIYGGKILTRKAKAEDIAYNIFQFISKYN